MLQNKGRGQIKSLTQVLKLGSIRYLLTDINKMI